MMLVALIFCAAAHATRVDVVPGEQMDRLLEEVDADGDRKITVLDLHNKNSVNTKKSFWLKSLNGKTFEVEGTFYLSNLLQELKLAEESHLSFVDSARIYERPVERISRLIRDFYWDNLTRRVDAGHIEEMLDDTKVLNPSPRVLYVPEKDEMAFEYFSKVARRQKFRVQKLGLNDTPAQHGLLSLALKKTGDKIEGVPFVVPGGRFNEMYGWDSYFEALGLIQDNKVDLAKAMLDNLLYEVDNYGKVLNANRSYYYDRSQPPFLTSYIAAVYPKLKRNSEFRAWLKHAVETAINDYNQVWMNAGHLTKMGLSRYGGEARPGIPPEVETGHFDFAFTTDAEKYHLAVPELIRRYNTGEFKSGFLDQFFAQDRAVRESGHDTTSRWTVKGKDLAGDFVTVDLNSLLYKYEIDLARILREEFGGKLTLSGGTKTSANEWRDRASKRKDLMLKYLWNPKAKIFFDYDFIEKRQSTFVSATAFYPFWAYDPKRPETRILSVAEAHQSFRALLTELDALGGILSTSKKSVLEVGGGGHPRQWDYPNGWAPHQMLAWTALRNFDDEALAQKYCYRWLYMITRNAVDYNGTIPEKFDVVKRSHAVFAEYGNVGTSFAYITREGFGWMNASYEVGLALLPKELREELDRLKPPEWLEEN